MRLCDGAVTLGVVMAAVVLLPVLLMLFVAGIAVCSVL